MAFRSFSKLHINTFPAIVTNYFICVVTGTLYTGFSTVVRELDIFQPWFYAAIALGLIFVTTFYLMARTTQLRGVAVASVASKMSLAIPVIFSLFIFKIGTNNLNTWNYAGIITAFLAILLVSYKKGSVARRPLTLAYITLPFAVFFMSGLIDTSLNYVNHAWVTAPIEPIFPILTFASAFLIGISVIGVKKIKVRPIDVMGGIYLGIPNYFSIYLQLKTLSAFDNNGAILYPSLNIGIIIGSTIAAILFFREYLSQINRIGIAFAVLAILLLSHQEILGYFS